jgi:hypothetical protein
MGERGDIIKTMHHEMMRQGLSRDPSEYVIYDPSDPQSRGIVGRVVARGISDESRDHRYLVIDGIDGRTRYIDIGHADSADPVAEGTIVEVAPKRVEAREVDRTVARIAAAHDGRYSAVLHHGNDPTASDEFVQAHVRRLEALRRMGRVAEREPDGTWVIAPDHIERAAAYERARAAPVAIETLSTLSLDRQIHADGATWLDRELVADHPAPLRESGFGTQARSALVRRQQWLIEQELAQQEQDRIVYRANMLGLLRRRELTRVAGQLSRELDLGYVKSRPDQRIEGVYRRRLNLVSGQFALIERSREFTLVPWRPVLERNLGKQVSGIMRGDNVSWKLGRQRGGPTVS